MPACSPDELRVDVDVDAGEFLKFTVTFEPGRRANYSVRDTTKNRPILGPPSLVAEWPPEGRSVDRGSHRIVFGADYLFATRFTYRVVLCRESGSTKSVVKQCEWEHPGRRPRSTFRAVVQ